MKRILSPTLHIEWAPGHVHALDTATGARQCGATISELASVLSGHRHAVVGVSRGNVFLRALRLPRAAREDLRRILAVQIGQFFPLPPDQMAFDFIQTDDQTAEGWLTVVAAVRSEDLKQLNSDLQQSGIVATRILPVALGAPLVASEAGLADALVVDASGPGLKLDVVQGGVLRFSRVTPAAVDPLGEAQRTLAAAGIDDLPLVAVGAADLPGASSFAGDPLTLLAMAPPFTFELAEDRAREAAKRAAVKTRLAVVMMAAAFLLAAFVWAERGSAHAELRAQQAAWNREMQDLRAQRTAEAARAQQAGAVEQAVLRAFEPGQPVSDIMAVVGDSLPSGAWLTGLTVERGKPIQIRGTARTSDDVAGMVSALSASPRFRDVRLVFANSGTINEVPVVQFNVTAVAVGNLPMPAPEAPTSRPRGAAATAARAPAGAASGGSGE